MSSDAVPVTKPPVPAKPTLVKAYKDSITIQLTPVEGAQLTVDYAESPALFYTWIPVLGSCFNGNVVTIPNLQPYKSFVCKVTATNAAGSTTSGTSDYFTTLTVVADTELRLKEALDTIVTLRSDIDKLNAELTDARNGMATGESAISEASSRSAALSTEVGELQSRLAVALTTADTLRSEIKTLKRETEVTSQLHATVDALRREKATVLAELDAAKKQTQTAVEATQDLTEKTTALTARVTQLETVLREKDTELEDVLDALAVATEGHKSASEAHAREVEALQEQAAKATAMYKHTDAAFVEMQSKANAEIKALCDEQAVVTAQLAATQQQLAEVNDAAAKTSEALTALQAAHQHCDATVADLQSKLTATEQAHRSVTEEKAALTAQLASHVSDAAAQADAAKELALHVDAANATIKALHDAAAQQQEETLKLREEVSTTAAAIARLNEELKSANVKYQELVSSGAASTALLQKQVAELTAGKQAAEEAHRSETARAAALETRVLDAESKLLEITGRVGDSTAQLNELRQKLAAQTARADEAAAFLAHTEMTNNAKVDELSKELSTTVAALVRQETLGAELQRKLTDAISQQRTMQSELEAARRSRDRTSSDEAVTSLFVELSRLKSENETLRRRVEDQLYELSRAEDGKRKAEADNTELMLEMERVRLASGDSEGLAAQRKAREVDVEELCLIPAFRASGIMEVPRLTFAISAFWGLRDMGFGATVARDAVMRYPNDTPSDANSRTSFCLAPV